MLPLFVHMNAASGWRCGAERGGVIDEKIRPSYVGKPLPVSGIMVLHDPLDWALEAQVVVDVLRGGDLPSLFPTPAVDCLLSRGLPQPRIL